jgi:hypothetical protein
MIKQPFTKTTKQPMSINLSKGPFMQRVLPTDTVQLLVEQKPVEINLEAFFKFYKTT